MAASRALGPCSASRESDQGGMMTKAELVESISAKTGVSKKDTGIIVNLILENISRALVQKDKVELRGFGSFKVKSRRSRMARNPRTGDSVAVPAKLVPYFKASNELKARLNL
jgi:integration host factor subunit beta